MANQETNPYLEMNFHLADGSVSLVAWLRHNCRLSLSSASDGSAIGAGSSTCSGSR